MDGNDPDEVTTAVVPTMSQFVSAFTSVDQDFSAPCHCHSHKNRRFFLGAAAARVAEKKSDIRTGIKNAWTKINTGSVLVAG